ncbi:hypothetical protein F4779DRAFT_614385 [Xylariaceae sp. FL0662B]|nr:hypothetical protein F4779DRAFT_614385 [Xylariaceae sp. FL0662B]
MVIDSDFDDSGLFGIQLSDSDGDANAKNAPPAPARDAQSEEAFEAVRRTYRAKVENGEIWKTIKLPLGPHVSKPEAQALLHAVEELYFFRRYAEGARFVTAVLGTTTAAAAADADAAAGLDEDTRRLLRYYEKRCNERAEGK